MIPLNFQGEDVYLLNERANWLPGMSAFFSRMSDVEGSAEGLESRTPLNLSVRTRLAFQLILSLRESAEFRVGLQRLENRRILCPFWAAAHRYYTGGSVYIAVPGSEVYTAIPGGEVYVSGTGEAPRVGAGIWLTFEPDRSAYEVHVTDAPVIMAPSLAAIRVPLLLGYFEAAPEPVPYTDELLKCDIKFKQSSAGAFSLKPINTVFADGPAVSNRLPQVFPIRPNWAKPVAAGGASVEVERNDLGFGGESLEVYYPQKSKRAMQLGFTLIGWKEIAQLLGFFHKRSGNVESFWIPGALAECKLAAPSSDSSSVITVDHAAGFGDNLFIAFVTPGGAPVMRRILSIAANEVTLDAPPGIFYPGRVGIVSLLLARFRKTEMEVKFDTDLVASAQIQFIETSDEYSTAPGETLSATYGALPAKAFLYRFYQRYPLGTVIDRFTSFEGTINAAGEIFISRKGHIDHADIEDSLDIERTSVKVRSRAFEGNPLLLLFPNSIDVPLELEILECSPDSANIAGAPRQLFIGEVTSPSQVGPKLTALVTHKLSTFSANVPTMLVQPTCPYKLYSGPCGLVEADWRFSAVVVSYTPSAARLVVGSISRALGLPAFDLGWFRFGKVYGGVGAGQWLRTIYESTAPFEGNLTLTLSFPIKNPPSVGEIVYLTPGCTGTVNECENKFANYPKNFGGSPFVPNGDPSFGEAPKTAGTGKK